MLRGVDRSVRLAALVLLAACADPAPDLRSPYGEETASAAEPILNGSPDTSYPAVVAVLGRDFVCSGTIVQVKDGFGYVMTAGHCCAASDPPLAVVQGEDYSSGSKSFVTYGSVTVDPCYQHCAGSTDDICMFKFSGASDTTPVIPVMTKLEDGLTVGTLITYVGYGVTSLSSHGAPNTQRRHVTRTIRTLDPFTFQFNETDSTGTCSGDSGGPGLVLTDGGAPMVAGITSYGDALCDQFGTSIRASAVQGDFVAPYLADTAASPTCPIETDCNVCVSASTDSTCGGGCGPITTACTDDADCGALVACYQACSDDTCRGTCTAQNLAGLQKYEAIEACLCTGSCSTVCAGSDTCLAPKCGDVLPAAPTGCASCADDHCCAEAWSCHSDPGCAACLFGSAPTGDCAQSEIAVAYATCIASGCAAAGCPLPNGLARAAKDGGTRDGGEVDAAPADGGNLADDAGVGTGGSKGASGCSCRAAGTEGSPGFQAIAALALIALGSIRRPASKGKARKASFPRRSTS